MEDALQEETRERTQRLSHISATVTTPDPMNPDDLEVIHVKAKLHKSKKKRSDRKKGSDKDPDVTSVNSLTLTSPVTTPLTPDSCYRSGDESISLDEAQEVFASEANSHSGHNATNVVLEKGQRSVETSTTAMDDAKTECDKSKSGVSKENCDDICSRVCDRVGNSTKTCDRELVMGTDVIPDAQSASEINVTTGTNTESEKGESSSLKKFRSDGSIQKDKTTTLQNTGEGEVREDPDTSISIYDSPKHFDQCSGGEKHLLHNRKELTDLAINESEKQSLVLVKTPVHKVQPEIPKVQEEVNSGSDSKPEVDSGSDLGSANDTPSSSLTNNDSGCVDLEAQIMEGEMQVGREDSSPDQDEKTLVEGLENVTLPEKQASRDSGTNAQAAAEINVNGDGQKCEGINSALIEDIASHNSPVRSFSSQNSLQHHAEIK